MSEFSIRQAAVNASAESMHLLKKDVADIGESIGQVRKELRRTFSSNNFRSLDQSLANLAGRVEAISFAAAGAGDALQSVAGIYGNTDRAVSGAGGADYLVGDKNGKTMFSGRLLDIEIIPGHTADIKPSIHIWDTRGWNFSNNLINVIKDYVEKEKGNAGAGAKMGMFTCGMAYVASLAKFLTGDKKGLTGASDVCSLAKSSCDTWNGLRKIVEYKEKALFKYVDPTGEHATQYGAKWSKIGGVVSIAGSTFGWTGDVINAFDKQKNPTAADRNAALISSTSNGVDIVTEVYDLKSKVHAEGLYTPAMLYGTVAQMGIETVSVAYKDYEKYMADGEWGLDDTLHTAIDSSTAGLGKMVDKLTFGLISEKTTGISSQQVSDALKAGAEFWGKDSGSRISNNPDRLRRYNNGNEFVKNAMIVQSIVEAGADYAKTGAQFVGGKIREAGEFIDSLMFWRR